MNRLANIDYCIRHLMRQERVEAKIPTTLKERQKMLRVLMNVWQPKQLSNEFLKAQDAELHLQLIDKGIVSISKIDFSNPDAAVARYRFHGSQLVLWQGDITRLMVDAIVNSANSRGLGCMKPLHACVDNDIHSAAGLQLRQECNRLLHDEEIAPGGAILTPSYNLPARYIIHTVGPDVTNGIPSVGQEKQLASCYRSCLWMTKEYELKSLAFCCISTGESLFPKRRAAEIAIATVRAFLARLTPADDMRTVVFCVFEDEDYAIYKELLSKR